MSSKPGREQKGQRIEGRAADRIQGGDWSACWEGVGLIFGMPTKNIGTHCLK